MNKLFFATILVVLLTLFANLGYSLSSTFFISTSGYDYCYLWGTGTTYSSARGTADYSICEYNYSKGFRIGQNVTGSAENVFRGYVRFNTSSLPDDAVVSGFKIAKYIDTNGWYLDTDTNISIRSYNWGYAFPLNESGNMELAYDGCLASSGEQVLYYNSSQTTPDYYTDYGVVYSPPMNVTSVINVTGYSYFCMLSNRDISNTAPVNNEFIDFYESYATNRLLVYYTIPAPAPIPDYINVTLLNPANNSVSVDSAVNFSYRPFANYPFNNCSLFINGVWNKSNSSAIGNNSINWINQTGFLNQTLNWTIGCWSNHTFNASVSNYTLNISKAYPVAPPIVPLDISDLPLFEFPSNQFCINDSALYLEYLYNISDNYSSNFVNRSYLTECAYGCSINRCNPSPLDTYLYLAGGILVLLVMLILFKMLL